MNKFTKVGITALAGSLASFAANAAALDVTGSAKLTYMSQDSSEVTGNPLGMNTAISFVGSGEVNGYATTLTIVNNDANTGLSSASLAVDLGDLGKLTFDQGVGHGGISTIDDKAPTANEEVWDSLDAVVNTANGLVGGGNSGVIVYANTYSDINLSAQFSKGDRAANADGASSGTTGGISGSSWDFALTSSSLAPGVDAGIGYGKIANSDQSAGADDQDVHMVVYANYTVGMATFGATISEVDDKSTDGQDEEAVGFGIAVNLNDNLSISYGEREVEYVNVGAADVTEDMTGYAVAYTAGSEDQATELALMLSF